MWIYVNVTISVKAISLGATNLLPSEIKANNVGELEKHKDKPIIVVDGSGMQCQESANALTKAGLKRSCVERRRSRLERRESASGAR